MQRARRVDRYAQSMHREAQRHLAGWMLQPIAEPIAEEARRKLGSAIKVDVMRPLIEIAATP